MVPDRILTIAREALHRHSWAPEPIITADTALDNDVDRQSIACRVEEEILDDVLPEHVWRGWLTVGAVLDCVRGRGCNA